MLTPSADPPLSADYLAANKGPRTLIFVILFPVLALLIVTLRLYTRVRIVRSPSHEDFAIALAMVRFILPTSSIMLTSCLAIQCRLLDLSRDS